LAQGAGAGEAAAKQLGEFGAVYSQSNELRNFLASPAVTRAARHGVIEKIVARIGGGKIIRNFLFVIADHQRTHLLPEIVAAFQQMIRQRRGIAEAEVSSAVELTATQKAELAKSLERITGKSWKQRTRWMRSCSAVRWYASETLFTMARCASDWIRCGRDWRRSE
jgi:F-type H+-transporting ATPase subunit delta